MTIEEFEAEGDLRPAGGCFDALLFGALMWLSAAVAWCVL